LQRLHTVQDFLNPCGCRAPYTGELNHELPITSEQEHILFLVNSYPPRVGGIERHIADLANEVVRQGHRVSVVTLADWPGTATENNIEVHRLQRHFPIASVMSFPSFGTARRLIRQFRHSGITAVSTHTRFFPMSWMGLRVARGLGVPVLHTEHGSDFVRGVSPLVGFASRAVDVTLGRRTLRGATSVLGVSEQVVAFVLRLAGVKANLFYNAITLEGWDSKDVAPSPHRRFVFVGRLVPGKGWDRLCAATTLLVNNPNIEPFTVDILGDGPDMPALLEEIESRDLNDIVRAHGYVDAESVRTFLHDAVLVNPTTLAEGFQTTLLEALAGGCQIVTFDVPGAAKLAAEGAPIRIVDGRTPEELAEAMESSLRNPAERYPFSLLGEWSWPKRATQYLGLIAAARHKMP